MKSRIKKDIDWPVEFLPDDVEEEDILDYEINRDLEDRRSVEERAEGLIEKLKNKQN